MRLVNRISANWKVMNDGRAREEDSVVGMGIDHSLPHSNWSRSVVAGDHFHGSIRRASVGNTATPQKQSFRIVNGTGTI